MNSLKKGTTQSCGCLRREIHSTHGEGDISKNKLYARWVSMRQRCGNPQHEQWYNYGGRGITVCKEWQDSYTAFRDWAHRNGYTEGAVIDRINNDKGYSPENCRWTTHRVNANNTRTNHHIAAFGEMKTLAEWGRDERAACPRMTILSRIRRGWDPEKAISTPPLWER